MYSLKYYAVLYPYSNISTLDLLFYDHIQLMDNRRPSNIESEELYDSGIIIPLEDEIDNLRIKFDYDAPEISKALINLETYLSKLYSQKEFINPGWNSYLNNHNIPIRYQNGSFNLVRDSLKVINEKMYTPKTQAFSYYLQKNDSIRAIPIIPDNYQIYSSVISGLSLSGLGFSIPKLPIRDLISFKHDNQDNLRQLRLLIYNLSQQGNDIKSIIEEISLTLKRYNNAVSSINQRYDLIFLELRFSMFESIKNFIFRLDTSIASGNIRLEHAKIQKQLEIFSAEGNKASYLYQIGKFFENRIEI